MRQKADEIGMMYYGQFSSHRVIRKQISILEWLGHHQQHVEAEAALKKFNKMMEEAQE